MSHIKTYFRLPPELGDGQHWTLCDTDPRGIELFVDHMRDWAMDNYGCHGESVRIEVVEMTDEQVAALPEI